MLTARYMQMGHSIRVVFFPLLAVLLLSGCRSTKFVGEGQTFGANQVKIDSRYYFRDLGDKQISAAKANGIDPIDNRDEAKRKVRQLRHVEETEYYKLDPMPHSIPYLTKEAHKLLKTIGKRFQKQLKRQGCRQHRIIATSMLRTRDDVTRLRKVNGNAAKNSAHMYGTTFDLSYTRFNRIDTEGEPVGNTVMANLLGEVIYQLRDEGRCWVIFERNQHCFHITSRR